MHLQENTSFLLLTLTFGSRSHKTCSASSTLCNAFNKKIHFLTFDIDISDKVTLNIVQYPQHYVLNCYDQRFKRRCICKKIHYMYLTVDLDLDMNHCPVLSTSYDLCTCKVWSCNAYQLRHHCVVTLILD